MTRIRIFTNEVAGGWLATDLNSFLGGSEECVVLLAEALQRKGFDVTVYHSFPDTDSRQLYKKDDVSYQRRETIDGRPEDILITFKDNLPWLGINKRDPSKEPAVKIHWSSEIEKPWDVSGIDYFVNLSPFHQLRHVFIPSDKSVVVPHGVEECYIQPDTSDIKANIMLYCSSPDRGLMQLLSDWGRIRAEWPGLQLRVTYGFKNILAMMPGGKQFEGTLRGLMEQDGVQYLGQLDKQAMLSQYLACKYWVLPLNNPGSELFCLNALKSRAFDCIPVVNRIGALNNTVGDYIPYKNFVNGNSNITNADPFCGINTWDQIVEMYWIPMFEKSL